MRRCAALRSRPAPPSESSRADATSEQDLNTGLLVLCDQAYLKRSIQKLTETYMTLSVREIARHVGGKGEGVDELKEVERVLLEMVRFRFPYFLLPARDATC